MVKVKWFGHSCWEIRGKKVTVLTDPHDGESLGLPVPVSEPDVLLVTHNHEDHASGVKLFNQKIVLDAPCETTVNGANIIGFRTYHDDLGGERLGENILFKFTVDDLSFGHTGDLGHVLDVKQLSKIGKIDILFSGISPTAQINIDLIDPSLVIPMHYHRDGMIFPWFTLPEIGDYIKNKDYQMLNTDNYVYFKDCLPKKRMIHVFKLK